MSCYYHSDRDAVCSCRECGALICEACSVEIEGKNYCKNCVASIAKSGGRAHSHERFEKRPAEDFNSFLAFMFSFVPGAGQMYMGLLKRGIQILTVFFASIALTSITGGLTALVIPIIYIGSFFDSILIRRSLIAGRPVEDSIGGVFEFFKNNRLLSLLIIFILAVGFVSSSFSFFGVRNLFASSIFIGGLIFVLRTTSFFGKSTEKPSARPGSAPSTKPSDKPKEEGEIDLRNN